MRFSLAGKTSNGLACNSNTNANQSNFMAGFAFVLFKKCISLFKRLLKGVFPHHTFNGPVWLLAVFGVLFLIVFYLNFAFGGKINKLANGHAFINFYRLFYRDFQRPVTTKTNISFTCGSMYVYAKPTG